MGWADRNAKQLADELGISARTVGRWVSGEQDPGPAARRQIAEICGVPPVFMDLGFRPLEAPITDTDRRLLELTDEVRQLQAGLATLSAERLRHTREQSERGETDHPAGHQEGG